MTAAAYPQPLDTVPSRPIWWSQAAVPLRPGALAPAFARRFVRRNAAQWRLSDGVADDAAAVAGALVLLSVRQARSPLTLRLSLDRAAMMIEVEDRCGDFPPLPSTGGRVEEIGLEQLHRVADAWGYVRRSVGRQLWARVGWVAAEDVDVAG